MSSENINQAYNGDQKKLSETLSKTLVPKRVKKGVKSLILAFKTFYCHNVVGKKKYINLRKANRNSMHKNVAAPNFLPYKDLAAFINNIDIGPLNYVDPDLVYDLTEEEIFPGNYRT